MVVFLLLAMATAAAAAGEITAPVSSYYNAIISFGDSFSDTGNFVIMESGKIPNIPKFPPPYARCSNGRLIVDLLAESFNLPLLPPSKHTEGNFSQGVNFAVMGATALDYGFFLERKITVPPINSSLAVQLEWFDALKPRICGGAASCRSFFRRTLFVVGEFGGNDYSFTLNSWKPMAEVKALVPLVIPKIIRGIEKLIDDGAVHIVVPGNLPAGCIPILLTFFATNATADYDSRTGCIKRLNSVALYHNAMLRIALDNLQRRRPEARIIFADYYTPVTQFVKAPALYGFDGGALRACCGGGGPYNYNVSAACGLPGATECTDADKYISWDGIHLTEAAYRFITNSWLNGPHAHPPILSVIQEDMVD